MRKLCSAALAALVLAGSAVVAQAEAPEPRATINVDRFMGRWYEIARTPNDHQKNCWAASQVWSRRAANSARILDTTTNAKWEASFFAGLIRQRYWVIDIAPDYSWMIATTADGQFPALLSRNPTMSAAQKTELVARMTRLGLPTHQLISR
jgi:apolipoprotein D and lipocalin family protein